MQNTLSLLKARQPLLWMNPQRTSGPWRLPFGLSDILDAEARLSRFAPLMAQLFDEAAESNGIIESRLPEIPELAERLLPGARMLLKADHDLPVAGSVKARGGIYEVLCFAEKLAMDAGFLHPMDNYRKLAEPKCRRLFGRYTVSVGSTGNLGLSIGTISAALGFKAEVHMSRDAKEWKKELLRSRGVVVVEHSGDYAAAVAQGRANAATSPTSYFVDDENSTALFLGYSVAALRLREQLRLRCQLPDERHPLFVYIPCGVGGAPGGICFGLKMVFGNAVQCFFAEPVDAPCMTLGMATKKYAGISVYDIGLGNNTAADGLACPRSSAFVGKTLRHLLDGTFTVTDEQLAGYQCAAKQLAKLKIECSAAAGFAGPARLAEDGYFQSLGISPSDALHILWTTGGRYLPEG